MTRKAKNVNIGVRQTAMAFNEKTFVNEVDNGDWRSGMIKKLKLLSLLIINVTHKKYGS